MPMALPSSRRRTRTRLLHGGRPWRPQPVQIRLGTLDELEGSILHLDLPYMSSIQTRGRSSCAINVTRTEHYTLAERSRAPPLAALAPVVL